MSSGPRALALAFLFTGACHKSAPAQKTVVVPSPMDAAVAPKPVVANSGPPTLTFSIVQTYAAQDVSTTAPWHVAGGSWTFFDAQTPGGARFTFGVAPHPPLSRDAQFIEGDGALSVSSSTEAAAFASEAAASFRVPAPVSKAHPQRPVRMHTQIVGEGVDCTQSIGCNDRGTWTATKLLLGRGDVEVFFNWDLPGKRGELVEASPDDDKAFVDILAGL